MEILVTFILILGIVSNLITSGIAYSMGRDARENETQWRILYGDDCYNNTFIMPFSIIYDLGYASYDKGKARAKRNKEKFNRKWGDGSDNNNDRVRNGIHHYSKLTHCKYGHEFTEDNTYVVPGKNSRHCRACVRRRNKLSWRRRNWGHE